MAFPCLTPPKTAGMISSSMKAMILAAGLGTRLLPYTRTRPKPLFTIGNRPILDILVERLRKAGFSAVIINSHHLSRLIADFVDKQQYEIPVYVRHEPRIMGTGGAVKNIEDLWDRDPLLVVNGDIFTDIDFKGVYDFHLARNQWVTMVLHDCPPYNNVRVDDQDDQDDQGRVVGFGEETPPPGGSMLAFTGVQVLSPEILDFIPKDTAVGIVDVYRNLIDRGHAIGTQVVSGHYWHDIGTPAGYEQAAAAAAARKTLTALNADTRRETPAWKILEGDGSDRSWQRVSAGGHSVILAKHGISPEAQVCEADAFVAIGRHLEAKGIPVPHIHHFDRPAGIVVMEDLGDCHFQEAVVGEKDRGRRISLYKPVIDTLVAMGVRGVEDFDTTWTYQTPHYDRHLIREKECDYFLREFVIGFRGLDTIPEGLEADFDLLSKRGLSPEYTGFVHRDFQSRNLLVHRGTCHVIDFQGGRLGPLPYDLAALLIDPYVSLGPEIEDALLVYYLERLAQYRSVDPESFRYAYRYCAVNRNLQALGAFAFLSRVKGKPHFETYIPPALDSLKFNLRRIEPEACPNLKKLVDRL